MNFTIERPGALCGILVLIPVLIYCGAVYRKTLSELSASYAKNNSPKTFENSERHFKSIKKRIIFRIFFRCLAWCMMVAAYAGISWGTTFSPIQKNGSAISFVFDISYSMKALDAPQGLSRLEAVVSYASNLLNHVQGSSVSAVLAKGSGVIAVPLTEDTRTIYTLLETISPTMLSSVGTNLGEGVLAALKSFPRSISRKQVIWLFTDGEETTPSLLNALNTALRQGVSVVIIGFGGSNETEVTAGDGKTVVKTALRGEKIRQALDAANKKNFGEQDFKFFKGASAKYVEASRPGSAIEVLSSIKTSLNEIASDEKFSLAYEIHSVERHGFFIFMAILFFLLSFVASELGSSTKLSFAKSKKPQSAAAFLLIFSLSFVSCSSKFDESKKVLKGVWNWHQKDYNEAVVDFSQTISMARENSDDLIEQYALYGLSATYLAQNENAAALEKINSLPQDAPSRIRFAAFYNSGIIAHRNGEYEKAVELFKQALLIDGANINAKINLEVSQNQCVQQAQEGEQNLSGAKESARQDSLLEESVFNRIKENEQQRWKNLQNEKEPSSNLDY